MCLEVRMVNRLSSDTGAVLGVARAGRSRQGSGHASAVLRGWGLAILLGATLAVSTACSGGGAPVAPSSSADASASASVQVTTPASSATATPRPTGSAYQPATKDHPARNVPPVEVPSNGTEKTEAGQVAFIKYWIASLNYSMETGTTDQLQGLSAEGCLFCETNQTFIESIKQDDGWIVGGRTEATEIVANLTPSSRNTYSVAVELNGRAGAVWNKGGRVNKFGERTQPRTERVVFSLAHDADGWYLNEVHEPGGEK